MEPIKFNLAFVERRMAEHKRWQHDTEQRLISEVIDEVQGLPPRAPKTGMLFEVLPGHVQSGTVVEMKVKRRMCR